LKLRKNTQRHSSNKNLNNNKHCIFSKKYVILVKEHFQTMFYSDKNGINEYNIVIS
jgi:hypothetical protein